LLFVLLVEYAITRPLERHLTHWRDHGVRKERRWLTR
jgi:hypothetical protein